MINPINQSQAERLIRIDNVSPNTKVYTEESFQTQQQGVSQITRMTKTKQWTSTENVVVGNIIRNETELDSVRSSRSQSNQHTLQELDPNIPATQYYLKSTDNLSLRPFRNNYSVSKSPSPNPNTLHRKHELRNPPPPIKFNISVAPHHLKIREPEFQQSRSNSNTCRASSVSTNNDYDSLFKRNYLTTQQLRNFYERGTSPFTYIETTSIKRKPNKKRRYTNDYNEIMRSSRSTPSRKETHKTLLFTKVSPSPSPSRCKSVKEFEENEFRAFERECEELRKLKLAKMNKVNSQYNTIRLSSERYSESLSNVKKLIELMQNANNRITKTEEKLCNLVSTVEVSSVENLSSDIERLLVELKNLNNSIKTRQDENLISEIIELTDQLRLSSNKIKYEVPNLINLLIDSDKLLKRYRELTIQISDREAILNQILRCSEQYKKSNNIQTNWFESINYKINYHQQQQQSLRSTINNDINYLKNIFDSNAKIFNELGLQDQKIEQVNEIGIKLIQLLKRYNRLLNDYYQYINIESTPVTRATNNIKLNYTPSSDIINQIRSELNNLNKQYATLLREYNTKIKTLTNQLAKSDKQFSFHITFKNVEPLIDKYNKDIFERYELIEEDLSNSYYDKDLMDINTIDVDNTTSRLYSTLHNTSTTTTNNYENGFNYSPTSSNINPQMSTVRYFASKINQLEAGSKFHPNQYPLSFIDAVNRKQLDLESGFFKDPINQTYTMRLYDALQKGYLNPKSAYVFDPRIRKSFYLDEAFQNSLINAQNRINDTTTSQTLSLSDALKCGYLKLGEFSSRTNLSSNNNNCSVTSETQSMSVRSIKDPLTGEFLVPTEAIKRKLLDPYKGLFLHPNGERLAISEAIKKGYVIVEMLSDLSSSQTSSMTESRHNSSSVVDTNLISTNLVRETKSYHLMGVYDPTKNDEITIKEAINRGILDRQRGLYIHPITKECFSISDAINKGVIRARVLMPPSEIPYESLISTNRFQENKTYTICGAIDPRNNRAVGLSRAIREGIINTNNGTYINILTGEVITLNVAIEKGLVLTDPKQLDNNVTNITHPLNREVKTLTIEFVKDPRSGRNLTVIEAMQNGILDRQTLHYYHPITGENFSLNKAYEKGFIIGHYTDSYTNEIRTQINSITTTTRKEEKYYIIVSVYDPRIKQSISLDQAINIGIFDPAKGTYIHPITKEVINIGDAVSRKLIEAKVHDDLIESEPYDTRLPIGDFGIDKKITSMRTKFNQEGRSILQIDIESTKPTKGVYEVDEIEEYTIKEPKPRHHTEYIVDRHDDSQREYRQVIDINSVHRIPAKQTTEHTIHHTQIDVPVTNVHKEKNVVVLEINKQIGADFRVERNEKVIDDDIDSKNRQILQIDIHKRKEIPERRPFMPYTEEIQRFETLVIDDVDNKRQKPLNIDSETHSYNNKLIIDSQKTQVVKQKTTEVLQINEFIKTKEPPKMRTEIIDDTKAQSSTTYLTIDDTRKRTEKIKEAIDISEIIKDEKPRKQEIIEDYQIIKKRNIYEDVTDVTKKPEKKPEEDEWRSESFEQKYYIQKTVNKVKEQPEEQRTDEWTEYMKQKIKQVQKLDDDDEEFFEEWTEVYTITIRGIKYKITWVYDPVISQRIPLADAIRKGIIDLRTNSYHNLKTSHSFTISEAYDAGLIGVEEDKNAFTISVNGITYTIYWVWDPVKKKRISPKRAIERSLLDLENKVYRNYANGETISIHEAIYMKLIGASEDLSNIDEELTLTINDRTYKIAWVRDSRTGDKVKPREALRRGLLDLTRYTYKKHDTNELLNIIDAIRLNYIGVSSGDEDDDAASSLQRQDSLLSIDEDELTIKTKTAIYVITGLLHPETQKEIKVSEAIEAGILNKETGAYKDFKTNVVYEVGDAINEGIVFATVTDLLQDQSASTEFIREEIKRYIVKSVIDPRANKRIGGLQAQAAGILNYAQGVYTNPDTRENMPIGEAIGKGLIKVELQEESAHEEFDAEVVTETLMERCITNYRIFDLGVLDPASHEMISGNEAVHKQVIDTETNSYVDLNEVISLKDAVSQNKVLAEVTERIERKPLGLTLQNALRLGLFIPDSGLFKDPYTNRQMKLNEAIERGHVNPNGSAVSDSTKGMMTLNEAFAAGVFDKRDGVLNKTRLSMFKGKLADSKLIRWNFEDAVKCGIVNLKNGKYKHMQSGELLSLRDAITRGLIDGDSTIIENPTTNTLMTLRTALDTVKLNDNGEVLDPISGKCITTLESAFNSRKIFSAFDENTGEIFLTSRGKIVSFEKAVRKNKMDKDVRIFDPKQNKELTVNDCIEHGILDRTSGMVIDSKSGGLLSIKEAVKRGIVSISGAPVVTGHHDSEAVEKATITSRKERHLLQPFDDVHDDDNSKSKSKRHVSNSSNSFDRSTLSSRVGRIKSSNFDQDEQDSGRFSFHTNKFDNNSSLSSSSYINTNTSTRKKTPIVYDPDGTTTSIIKDSSYILSSDPNEKVVTKVTTKTEEHHTKISGDDVKDKVKKTMKETIIEPDREPHVTSSTNYEYETKSKVEQTKAADTTDSSSNGKILDVSYEGKK